MNFSESISELCEQFQSKITGIEVALQLRHAPRDAQKESMEIMNRIYEQIVECKCLLSKYEAKIEETRKETDRIKESRQNLHELNRKITHILNHLPADYPPSKIKENEVAITNKLLENPKKGSIPIISYLTSAEFQSIPSYMIGRITQERMTEAINNFNHTIGSKYSLLMKPKSSLSKKDAHLQSTYRMQVTKETKGLYFCTADDLNAHANFKMDNTGRAIIASLRHCRRIRELRKPGGSLYYVIVTS